MKRKLIFSYSFLAIALVLLVVGVFAWFSLTETSKGQGASIVATTKGNLKIYPEVDDIYIYQEDDPVNPGTDVMPKAYSELLYPDFKNIIDFSTSPFKATGLIKAERSNISGDGATFFYLASETPEDTFASVASSGNVLYGVISFSFYFTAFSGAVEGEEKEVYLTSGSLISDVPLKEAVRVAFIDADSNIVGIWAPHGGTDSNLKFVTSAGTAIAGTITTATDPIPTVKRILHGTAGTATTLLTVDTSEETLQSQFLKVVMWVEGTATSATDVNLGQELALTLEFALK